MIDENTQLLPSKEKETSVATENSDDGVSKLGEDAKKKTKGVKLDAVTAIKLEQEVNMNMVKHQLASKYLSARQFWFFTVPQALLTMLSGILAFLATTDLLNATAKIVTNTIVGSISGVVVFLQTMSGNCNYGTRAAMHGSTAIDLRDLRDDLVLLKQKLELIESRTLTQKLTDASSQTSAAAGTNDTMGGNEDENTDDQGGGNFNDIQTRFKQSLSGCKSTVPMPISEAFHGLQSDMLMKQSKKSMDYLFNIYQIGHFNEYIELKAFDMLAGEIMHYPLYPLYLPNSEKMVEETMDRLKKEIHESESFWIPEPV